MGLNFSTFTHTRFFFSSFTKEKKTSRNYLKKRKVIDCPYIPKEHIIISKEHIIVTRREREKDTV